MHRACLDPDETPGCSASLLLPNPDAQRPYESTLVLEGHVAEMMSLHSPDSIHQSLHPLNIVSNAAYLHKSDVKR